MYNFGNHSSPLSSTQQQSGKQNRYLIRFGIRQINLIKKEGSGRCLKAVFSIPIKVRLPPVFAVFSNCNKEIE